MSKLGKVISNSRKISEEFRCLNKKKLPLKGTDNMPLHVYYSSKKSWQEVGKKIGYEKVLITFNGFLKDFNIIMIP